ncbi:IMP1 (YMR150C) [Zygosaccharomyces parabailii]|nr:IMP1 (YMR150C) [Zygosaccharomyces parabailii]CDH13077.1 probable Mitochondrial inner membrane protease subunit 1 [Zygosaccharomyces bailii ISA1307]
MNPTIQAWVKTGSYALRAVCFVHIVHTYIYEFTETRGESMLPTLAASNDYVHAFKKYKDGKGCKMGDCIVAIKPSDPDHRVCKRITGMPGDVILVDPSAGVPDASSYLPSEVEEFDEDESFQTYVKVPKGHVWVTGDNLSHSLDSRTYNSLPMGLIRGKILAANDFNEPFWGGRKGNFWGFRKIQNTYVEED